MDITRTSLRSERKQQVPKQVSQGQTQQRGGYGEELKQQGQEIFKVRSEKPIIKSKKVDPIVSPTKQYTKDAVKTALEKLKKFIVGRGLGGDKSDAAEQTTPFASTGGGGGKKNFFTGLTNDQLGLLSTDKLVARDIKRYGNTVPEGSFGSGSLPGSAVDTNIARHSVGTSGDQPPTVKFGKTLYGQGGLPLGTTTQRQGGDIGISGDGPAVNASGFQQKNVRGSAFNTGKDESARPKQTVAALPSNYKATEKAAFDKAKSWQDSKAKGDAAAKATNTPSKPPAGSFGISAEGKKQAEANKAEKKKATPTQKTAVKKATTVKKSSTSSSGISKTSSRGQGGRRKSSGSKSGGSKSGGSKSGGSKSGGSKSSNTSRNRRGGKSSSKGGSFGGKRRKSNTRRSRRRCDLKCKVNISLLTSMNLMRDDLADVAYFVKELQEIN